jgi:membrane protease YdiL (CAAX protease family)
MGRTRIIVNIVWAFWHMPLILYGVMGGFSNFTIDFLLFTISAIELGIILLYVRLKTGSVIPVMIIHGFINFFRGNIIHIFFIYNEHPDWSLLIQICVFLPFVIYYYKKGRTLYNDKRNTVANIE